MFRISDIKHFDQCKYYFYHAYHTPLQLIRHINYHEDLQKQVIQKLQIDDYFLGAQEDSNDKTLAAFYEKKNVVNAHFKYQDLRVVIPVIVQKKNCVVVYFIYPQCFPKEKEAQSIVDQLWVLDAFQLKVDEVYIVYQNAKYIREDKLDYEKLLVCGNRLFNARNKPGATLKKSKNILFRDVSKILHEMRLVLKQEHLQPKRKSQCTKAGHCPFYQKCFHEEECHNSILNLVQSKNKVLMLKDGATTLKQANLDLIEGTRLQYAQIMADRNGSVYVDQIALRVWFQEYIHYPLSYLDFEWDTFATPPYRGMKPYDVLAFQYSLHIEEERDSALIHKEFLMDNDCRINFIEQLLHDIPKQGSIIVFNMEGAEKLRLVQLSNQFPQYTEKLAQIWERMVDLSLPFSSGNFYDLRMQGCYSLKVIVTLFANIDYEKLVISNGTQAMEMWRTYSRCAAGVKKNNIHNDLLEYCALDTYAEWIIVHGLMQYIG